MADGISKSQVDFDRDLLLKIYNDMKPQEYTVLSFCYELREWVEEHTVEVDSGYKTETKKFLFFKWKEKVKDPSYDWQEANLKAKREILERASNLKKKYGEDRKVIIICEYFNRTQEDSLNITDTFTCYGVWEDGSWIEPKFLNERKRQWQCY